MATIEEHLKEEEEAEEEKEKEEEKEEEDPPLITIISFGNHNGKPKDTSKNWDVRNFPNPPKHLRDKHTGLLCLLERMRQIRSKKKKKKKD